MPHTTENITVTDMLGQPPGWLLRSGISLVFVVVLSGILLSAFIYYPDKIQAAFTIQQSFPPVSIQAQRTAKLDTLLVRENEAVSTGQLLGVLNSAADWQQILALDALIQNEEQFDQGPLLRFEKLGNLQSGFANYLDAVNAYIFFNDQHHLKQELAALENEKRIYDELKTNSSQQINLLSQQLYLENKDLERQNTLLKDGVISEQEYEQNEKTYLQLQQQLESLKANRIQHELRISEIQKQQYSLKKGKDEEAFNLQQAIQQNTEELNGQLQSWKEQYLLTAPINGQAVLKSDVVAKQQINAGDPILTIIPASKKVSKPYVRLKAAAIGIGKIEIGDAVLLELDAYPSKEYGIINTQIARIHPLPQQGKEGEVLYEFTAAIHQPMITSYGKEIPLQEILSGTASIITKNRSVLARIFEQLLDLVKNDGN